MTHDPSFTFGHKPIFKSPPEVIDGTQANGTAGLSDRTQTSHPAPEHSVSPPSNDLPWLEADESTPKKNAKTWSLKRRMAALLAVIAVVAVPTMAAPKDFGALPGGAPTEAEMVNERLQEELARNPAMPFERPGMSFPGSAFFFLAEPPAEALIALPSMDALAPEVGEAGRELGELIDAGPSANPFFGAGGSLTRAQDCLAQAIWYEAASESEAGQRAVAQVVLNRVSHPSWPSSVCGVVYQGSNRRTGCQFTFTCDGSLRRKASGRTWSRAQSLASEALSGSVYEPIGHATHYHTLWVNPYWASSLDHVGTIGAHRFYRNRGSAGRKDAFTQTYAGVEPDAGAQVTAPPRNEIPELPGNVPPVTADAAGYAPAPSGRTQAPSGTLTQPSPREPASGPGALLTDPSVTGAGQVRDDYARAGQWKDNAARAALIEDQERPPQQVP